MILKDRLLVLLIWSYGLLCTLVVCVVWLFLVASIAIPFFLLPYQRSGSEMAAFFGVVSIIVMFAGVVCILVTGVKRIRRMFR